jgi:penicillin amidase
VSGRNRVSRRAAPALVVVAALIFALAPARAATDIRIIRDRFGVPHIFGPTAEDVSYGAGYALAKDRLWQMHLFRLIAKGHLSDLLGSLVTDIDKEIRFFTYTEAERKAKFDNYPGKEKQNLVAFAAGVNAWIAQVRTDPTKLPFEFVEFGVPEIRDWTIDDSLALSDVLILSFGSGGGNELEHLALLKNLVARYGEVKGLQMFDDLVVTEDPDGPITIPTDYDYAHETTAARVAEAESRRALHPDARLGLAANAAVAAAGTSPAPRSVRSRPTAKGTMAQLRLIPDIDKALAAFRPLRRAQEALQRMFHFGSNAQVVGPAHTETGNAAQTAGPQVDYLLPQWLSDFGLHSADGTLDATGMTFAGAGPAVLIGRGNGYAWTTTTGSSDLTDTYVEKLNPNNPREYLFNGRYEKIQCRTEEYVLRGIVPVEEQEICRTRHGPVLMFDEANGIAISVRYSWFNREAQTVEGFFSYNRVKSLEDFATFANYLGSNHNMFYVDDQGHYGYWTPGNHPVRATGVDIRLPQDGTGGSEWQGLVPIQEVPHAVDFPRGWLSNWNNQPGLGWKRERGWSAIDNAADLARTLDPALPAVDDPRDGVPLNPDRKLDFEDLSGNLRYSAFKDHRDTYFRPYVPADAALGSDLARAAAKVVRDWNGFLTDHDDDGLYDSAGTTIIREWVSQMRVRAFSDDLGGDAGWANESLLWHLLTPNDTLVQGFDWLGAATMDQIAAQGFNAAVAALQTRFESSDPTTWKEKASKEHYQRLNADLFVDTALTTAADEIRANGDDPLAELLDDLAAEDLGLPGDVVDQVQMDRGTYNHVVTYLDPPTLSGPIGASRVHAGSVIPPGQSGFINLLGQEAPHYEDQAILYLEWRYKPMPMTLAEALALKESEETISR